MKTRRAPSLPFAGHRLQNEDFCRPAAKHGGVTTKRKNQTMKRFLFVQAIMLACLAWQLAAAPAGDPLDHWRQLNPDADLFDVAEVRFSNGRWVAVPGGGGH